MAEDKVDDKNIDGIVNDIDQNDDNVILECEGDDEGEREHVQQDEDHDDPLRHGVSRQYESQGGLKRTQNLILFDTRQATGARRPNSCPTTPTPVSRGPWKTPRVQLNLIKSQRKWKIISSWQMKIIHF